jgi:sugar lactone lactonase YvrE
MDSFGNLYVGDAGNGTIRRIAPSGMVSTLAGTAGTFGSSDGTGAAARFNGTTGLATDTAGNVYVADSGNSTIRKITPAGVVTTLAGTAGNAGSADGTGAAARFDWPRGVTVDGAGNVYVADEGNCTIRKITPAGVVTTVAGNSCLFNPIDGKGTAATFNDPVGLSMDSSGNLYVADWQLFGPNPLTYAIRKITPNYVVTTLAVQAAGVVYDGWPYIPPQGDTYLYPIGLATDSTNNVYVTDPTNSVIRKITPAGVVSTFAGSVFAPGSADGTGAAAQLYDTFGGVATDSAGNVYVADDLNDTIRVITPGGVVSTLAGTAGNYGSADGTGTAAQFEGPQGVATDSAGNVYVADAGNQTIRKITPAGVVSTLAGTAGTSGSADGNGAAAQFNRPSGVATDSSGNVYVADSGNHTVRKITPAELVTTLAGTPGISGSVDGVGAAAQFAGPSGIATDSAGNVYVADGWAVRKITPAGAVSTIAAAAGSPLATSGVPTAAGFFAIAVSVDSAGNVYVANGWDIRHNWNSFIYEVSTAGVISTIAGVAGQMGFQPGSAPGVLAYPVGIALSGNSLYIVMQNGVAVLQGI